MPRHLANALSAVLVLFLGAALLRLFLAPDPAAGLFARAQQLEKLGQTQNALRLHELIATSYPTSFFAPRALAREGDLLAAQGRTSGDQKAFREALVAYEQLATNYPDDALADDALLSAGKIARDNLNDPDAAKRFYERVLARFAGNPDLAATATLQLGCLALDAGDKSGAQELLQRILQKWPRQTNQASQAQFQLGVLYETLFKNIEWAKRAYNATIERYPNSTWANDARQRLGFMVFTESSGQKSARRVLIQIAALPDGGDQNGSLWAALGPILAARGLETDQTLLTGLSLTPFWAGFDPPNPGKVPQAPFDGFENVLANAGLRFSVKSGGNEASALADLQDTLDGASAPLVFWNAGRGQWSLVVGYDSARGEVMLQNRGARFDTLNARVFAAAWKTKSLLGGPFTLLDFVGGAKPKAGPTPTPSTPPSATPQIETVPTFTPAQPQISAKNAFHHAAARAALLLARPEQNGVLLGANALEFLAATLERAGQNTTPTPTPLPTDSPYAPAATPVAPNAELLAAARRLEPFFGAPAREWAAKRRQGAAFLESVGFKGAAADLRQSADALDDAAAQFGVDDFAACAEALRRARDAERRAAQKLQAA